MNYWLFKTEPDVFGIEDLESRKDQREPWDGIRNYQARNLMRDEMKVGDKGFFYHSRTKVPGIVGIVEVVKEAYVDHTQFDPEAKYYDAKADPENPRWLMVDVQLKAKFAEIQSLSDLKAMPELEGMMLTKRGARLSIQPVSEEHWQIICDRAGV